MELFKGNSDCMSNCNTSVNMFRFILLLIFFISTGKSQDFITIGGSVKDSLTGEVIPFVNVAVPGTQKGTITDIDGAFVIRLPAGNINLVFSSIGYKNRRVSFTSYTADTVLQVVLEPAVYELPPVSVTGEDPGIAIMRGVIGRKKRQKEILLSYTYDLYTKFIVSTDTATAGRSSGHNDTTIFSILESYSKGYYKSPDKYHNEIYKKRQSVNVPAEANFVAFGTNINLYDDVVEIVGEEVYSPFHPDAISFYDFRLLQWLHPDKEQTIARIKVTPRTNQRKLFEGILLVNGSSGVPLSAELKTNVAVQLPFNASLSYSQSFSEFDSLYVMPTGLQIVSHVPVEIFWLYSGRLDIRIYNVVFNYSFNPPVDEALFDKRRVESKPDADKTDEQFWNENIHLPLKPEEAKAYEEIRIIRENPDSIIVTSFFERYVAPVSRTLGKLEREPFTGFDDFLRYNRVSGFYLGGGYRFIADSLTSITLKAGYSISDKKPQGEFNLVRSLDKSGQYTLNLSAYSRLQRRDIPSAVSDRTISLMSFFFRNDYGDYYYADEIGLSLGYSTGQLTWIRRSEFVRPLRVYLGVKSGYHKSAVVKSSFSVFGGKSPFRENPAIDEGRISLLYWEFNYNYHPQRRLASFGFQLTSEWSRTNFLRSQANYTILRGVIYLRTTTLPLWTLDLRIAGGTSRGQLPVQKYFSYESSTSALAMQGVFRGIRVKEFYGENYITVFTEHNFGEIFPGLFRIPNVTSFGVEFIVNVNAGWSSINSLRSDGTVFKTTESTPEKYYLEGGIGINRLLLFFRFDVSARFTQVHSPVFFFTFSTATN